MTARHPAPDSDALFFTSDVTSDAIAETSDRLGPVVAEIAAAVAASPSARLYLVGGGASNAAMHGAKYLLDRFGSVPSDVLTGWQLVSRAPASLGPDSFLFLTSYSGQTPEVLRCAELARKTGARVVAITETTETPLAKAADWVLDYRSKAVFTVPLALVYRLAAEILRARGESVAAARGILTDLDRLPELIAPLVAASDPVAREMAAEVADVRAVYVLGSGPNYGLAYKLALSVVIENLWLDAAPVDSGEFYHGPIEIIASDPERDRDRLFLHLLGTDASRAVGEQAVAFCTKMGARQLVFDAADAPGFGELFAPFALFVPTEWWVMHMAAQKGHDVDERRYMGKIGARWGEYA